MSYASLRIVAGLPLGGLVLLGALLVGTGAFPQAPPAAPAATPRLADGHPDLNGYWVAGGANLQGGFASGLEEITFAGRGGTFRGFEEDGGLIRMNDPNRPVYKPEFWPMIREADYQGNWQDPMQFCMPLGVPRLGPPARIVVLPKEILLFYTGGFTRDTVRSIRMDAQHNPVNVALETWSGDSVGRWDGDTLVIETIGFTDSSWLHKNGYIHGFNMKVVEKLVRQGDGMRWEATVDDPEYLQQPWTLTPVMRQANKDPNAWLSETLPCDERDRDHITSHTRSG